MNDTVPKFIGFENELVNYLLGAPSDDNAARAAAAIVEGHHHVFGCQSVDVESSVNEFDPMGFRFYVDHLHAEISSPLAASARDLVFVARVAHHMLQHCVRRAEQNLGVSVCVGLDTTSRHGTSWGSHLNIMVARSAFDRWRAAEWAPMMKQWVPFVVTSPGLLGAGKIGAEAGGSRCLYQMSQRSDFVDNVVGLETVSSKSCINERDEALADPERYARFHIIAFDLNRCEFANFLKFGTSQLVLSLIEEGYSLPDLRLANPLAAFATSSRDLQFKTPLELADGRQMTALEVQYRLSESVADAVSKGSAASQVPDAQHIVEHWIRALNDLAHGAAILTRRIDWRARLELIRRARMTKENRAQAEETADVHYGAVGGVFERLEDAGAVEVLEDFLPHEAGLVEPTVPREGARGLLLARFGEQVLEANWHYLLVQGSSGKAWRISMDDPVDSDKLLHIAQSSEDTGSCLDRLIREGFATKCALEVDLLVVSGSPCKEDEPNE